MATIIKRLEQQGVEFVPITLAEAVVVNTTGIIVEHKDATGSVIHSLGLGITTLDKVLHKLFEGYDANVHNIENALTVLNNKLSRTDLKAGDGISLDIDTETGLLVISTDIKQTIFMPVASLPPVNSADRNTIYLVKSGNSNDPDNTLDEYIVTLKEYTDSETGNTYQSPGWEKLGTVKANGVDEMLTNYYTKKEADDLFLTIEVASKTYITAHNIVVTGEDGGLYIVTADYNLDYQSIYGSAISSITV